MGFFKGHRGRGSYEFLSIFNNFMPGYIDLAWIVIFMILGVFLGSAIIAGIMLAGYPDIANTYGILLAYPLMFIPAMLFASARSRKNDGFEDGYAIDNHNFGSHKAITMIFVAIVLSLATAFVIEPISMMLPEMSEEMKAKMDMMLGGPAWVTFISVSVFAPFFEEWLCRGIVLRGLLKKTSPVLAIVISAAFFALIHMNLWQAIPAFLMGLIFGVVYYKTGSLKLTMLMHFANNTMAWIVSLIPSLEDAEYFSDVLSPWAYGGVYAVSVIVLLFGCILLKGIPQKEGNLGGCQKIPSIF